MNSYKPAWLVKTVFSLARGSSSTRQWLDTKSIVEEYWVPLRAFKLLEINGNGYESFFVTRFNFWKSQQNLVDPCGLLTSTTGLTQGDTEGWITLHFNMSSMCFSVVSFWTFGALYGCSLIGACPSVSIPCWTRFVRPSLLGLRAKMSRNSLRRAWSWVCWSSVRLELVRSTGIEACCWLQDLCDLFLANRLNIKVLTSFCCFPKVVPLYKVTGLVVGLINRKGIVLTCDILTRVVAPWRWYLLVKQGADLTKPMVPGGTVPWTRAGITASPLGRIT